MDCELEELNFPDRMTVPCEDLLSRHAFIFLSTMGSVILFLFLLFSILIVLVILGAYSVKKELVKEESNTHSEQYHTSSDESILADVYSKLPNQLIMKKSSRKISRLSSIAKITKVKDFQDATHMLQQLVIHKN